MQGPCIFTFPSLISSKSKAVMAVPENPQENPQEAGSAKKEKEPEVDEEEIEEPVERFPPEEEAVSQVVQCKHHIYLCP